MKQLVFVIHEHAKRDIADLLHRITQVHGFTFSGVEGHGGQSEHDPFLSMRDKVVGYAPHVRVDILLEDGDVAPVLAALRKSKIGVHKRGIYWTTAVEESGRL